MLTFIKLVKEERELKEMLGRFMWARSGRGTSLPLIYSVLWNLVIWPYLTTRDAGKCSLVRIKKRKWV